METLLTSWRYGQIHIICEDTLISNSLLLYGEWAQKEINLLKILSEKYKDGNLVFGGANIGIQTIALSQILKNSSCTIHSFEIHPQIFEVFLKNIEASNCSNVKAYNQGLSDQPDNVMIPAIKEGVSQNIGAFSLHTKYSDSDIKAELTTIDHLNLTNCSLIHLDLEKHELSCLKGAINTISKFKPDIYAEVLTPKYCNAIFNLLNDFYSYKYLFLPGAFNPENFKNEEFNIFSHNRETAIILTNSPLKDINSLYQIKSTTSITKLFETFSSHIYTTPETISQNEIQNSPKPKFYTIQTYIDTGEGFNEENSIIYRSQSKYISIATDLNKYDNIQNIRIDPNNDKCIIKIHNISIKIEDEYVPLNVDHIINSSFSIDSYFLFDNEDPQLIYQNILDYQNISELLIEIEYFDLSIDLINILFHEIGTERTRLLSNLESYIIEEDNNLIQGNIHSMIEDLLLKHESLNDFISEKFISQDSFLNTLKKEQDSKTRKLNKKLDAHANQLTQLSQLAQLPQLIKNYKIKQDHNIQDLSQSISSVENKMNIISDQIEALSQNNSLSRISFFIKNIYLTIKNYALLVVHLFLNFYLIKELILNFKEITKRSNWKRLLLALRHEPISKIIGNSINYLKSKRTPHSLLINDKKNGKIAFHFERIEMGSNYNVLIAGWLITERPYKDLFVSFDSLILKSSIICDIERIDVLNKYPFPQQTLKVGFSRKFRVDHYVSNLNLNIVFENGNTFTHKVTIHKSFNSEVPISQINKLLRGRNKKKKVVTHIDPVYIVLPIYNAYDLVTDCIKSVIENTTGEYHFILINDCSTDERIVPLLDNIQKQHSNFQVIHNETNIGFIKSINKAYQYVHNHFIILNSDTVVTDNWTHKLLSPILLENAASCTPISNSATIYSFPNQDEDNELYLNFSPQEINEAMEIIQAYEYITIPTGVGFCMAFNFNVTEEIGLFDTIFGKGYAEENDWCMRANLKGHKHTLTTNCFIYHKHGGSFLPATKNENLRKNLAILNQRYSEYDNIINSWITQNPLKPYFTLIKILLQQRKSKRTEIIVDYTQGGGAAIYRNNHIKKLRNSQDDLIIFIDGTESIDKYRLKFYFNDEISEITSPTVQEIELLFSLITVHYITLNDFVGSTDLFNWYPLLKDIKSKNDCLIEFLVHDYHAICPSYNLLNSKGLFCGVPEDMSICIDCIASIVHTNLFGYDNIETWRKYFDSLLNLCDIITCFSNSSEELILKAYADLADKIQVKPHTINHITKEPKISHTGHLVIGILGGINYQKGAEQIIELASHIDTLSLPIEIVVIGQLVSDQSRIDQKCLKITGAYDQNQIVALTEKHKINVYLIPSIWPETFSYTTEEIIKMNLPLAVFNIGAPYERVLNYPKGIILDYSERDKPQSIIDKILQHPIISVDVQNTKLASANK